MTNKKTIADVDVSGKRVLMRVDFNVPLDKQTGQITDDRRIQQALPTIRSVLDRGGRLILMSHLGRPDGKPDPKASLGPCAKHLGDLLGKQVAMLADCVGDPVRQAVGAMKDGDCCMLENLRFHVAEVIKDKQTDKVAAKRAFAQQLADLADVYVNDAFGTCHRDNASMLTVPQLMEGKPRVIGFLIQKELEFLGKAMENPARPFVALLGGAKVSDKLGVIRRLLQICDRVLIGGAMAYTFFAAAGRNVGKSLCEHDRIDDARGLSEEAGEKLLLPLDTVVVREIKPGAANEVVEDGLIPPDAMGVDIGPQTVEAYRKEILAARTIVWNGPMGVFEMKPFDVGTMGVCQAVGEATAAGAVSIIGGGDSSAAVSAAGLEDRMSHISTGGGASLEFLEGRPFKPLEIIDAV
ncbi:MAG TPA: phosphoglycerate kinase [Phycisphaerae bacterium]|nr:phosphoglycerate kinase [Phycisphaerae bacterium]